MVQFSYRHKFHGAPRSTQISRYTVCRQHFGSSNIDFRKGVACWCRNEQISNLGGKQTSQLDRRRFYSNKRNFLHRFTNAVAPQTPLIPSTISRYRDPSGYGNSTTSSCMAWHIDAGVSRRSQPLSRSLLRGAPRALRRRAQPRNPVKSVAEIFAPPRFTLSSFGRKVPEQSDEEVRGSIRMKRMDYAHRRRVHTLTAGGHLLKTKTAKMWLTIDQ